jgi:hypothetical protein
MAKMRQIDPSKPPFHWCPRFDRCSANRCPFDPEIGKKVTLRGEEKCGLAKSRRMRLWEGDTLPEEKKALLPYQGMFKREFSARQRWDNLPEEEKARKREVLTAQIKKARLLRGNQGQSKEQGEVYPAP